MFSRINSTFPILSGLFVSQLLGCREVLTFNDASHTQSISGTVSDERKMKIRSS